MKKYLFILMLLIGCTDAQISHWKSYNKTGKITCYSGDKIIYIGHSTGKILTTSQSDGWEFMDFKTKKLVRISGTCVVESDVK